MRASARQANSSMSSSSSRTREWNDPANGFLPRQVGSMYAVANFVSSHHACSACAELAVGSSCRSGSADSRLRRSRYGTNSVTWSAAPATAATPIAERPWRFSPRHVLSWEQGRRSQVTRTLLLARSRALASPLGGQISEAAEHVPTADDKRESVVEASRLCFVPCNPASRRRWICGVAYVRGCAHW
jgi:hypothetical protein